MTSLAFLTRSAIGGAFMTLVVALSGCDTTGACVSSGASDYEICNNDWVQSDCDKLSPAKFYAGQTCAELGYTMACSKAEHNCWCRVGDPYCP